MKIPVFLVLKKRASVNKVRKGENMLTMNKHQKQYEHQFFHFDTSMSSYSIAASLEVDQ